MLYFKFLDITNSLIAELNWYSDKEIGVAMSNRVSASKETDCQCDYLVELTQAQDMTTLDCTLESQLSKILEAKKFYIIRRDESLSLVSSAKIKTTFDLSEHDCSIAKIIIESNLDNEVTGHINTLLEVYQNQYRLIARINNDQLTKLGNRHALENKFYDLFHFGKNKRRTKEKQACVGIFDIDHFKSINDTFGHLYGDEVLVHLSQLMLNTFRDTDFLFRYGGEEFVVILTDLDLKQAYNVLERFRKKVEEYSFPFVGNVTISLGLTSLNRSLDSITMIAQADKALYYAKENGRNQLHAYENLIENGKLQSEQAKEDDITLFN